MVLSVLRIGLELMNTRTGEGLLSSEGLLRIPPPLLLLLLLLEIGFRWMVALFAYPTRLPALLLLPVSAATAAAIAAAVAADEVDDVCCCRYPPSSP